MSRNGHDGACSVSGQYIIADPDRNSLLCKRIDGIRSGEYAGHTTIGDAFAFRLLLRVGNVFIYVRFLCGCGQFSYQFAFGSEHHEGDAEDRIGTCREDGERLVRVLDLEFHLGTFAASDPVALCLFQGIGPVDGVQSVQQTLCIR